MPLIKTVRVDLGVSGTENVQRKFDEITLRANELSHLNPTIQVDIQSAAAMAKLAILKREFNSIGRGGIGGGLGGLGGAGGAAGGAGALGGSPLAWLIGAGAILSPPAIGAGLGLAGFGAVAIPTLSKISTALTATGTA